MRRLREAAGANPDYPEVLFVYQGSISDGERFFGTYWPEIRGIADSEKALYDAFGIRRGKAAQVVGPKVWWRGFVALLQGHIVGRLIGDPFLLSGLFLVRDGNVIWEHRSQHSADHPDFRAIPEQLNA